MGSNGEQHSPLPWHGAKNDRRMIVAANGARVADYSVAIGMSREEQEANAAISLRAVNNHEALKEALSGLGWHSSNLVDVCWCHVKSDGYAKHTEPCKAAREAIALAEKG